MHSLYKGNSLFDSRLEYVYPCVYLCDGQKNVFKDTGSLYTHFCVAGHTYNRPIFLDDQQQPQLIPCTQTSNISNEVVYLGTILKALRVTISNKDIFW
jgi:hypothetical protein